MSIKKEIRKLEDKGKALQKELESRSREIGAKSRRLQVKAAEKGRELEERGRILQDKVSTTGRELREKIGSAVARRSPEPATEVLKKKSSLGLGIERILPSPGPLEMNLGDALGARKSARAFREDTIPDDVLSTLLWAVDGVNREDGGRTTPSPVGWHGMLVFVVKSNGVWLWNPGRHALTFVRGNDQRGEVAPLDLMAARAPVHLVYVADFTGRTVKALETADEFLGAVSIPASKRFGVWAKNSMRNAVTIDAGSKIQACHLACAALGLATTARVALDHRRIAAALALSPRQVVVAAQVVGYSMFGDNPGTETPVNLEGSQEN